jgi:hypothetical protein
MRRRTHALMTCVMATIILTATVGSADARILEVSNQQFRITWGAMTFREAANAIQCKVTLEGSFHRRTIAKVSESLIGHITRASSGNCTGGTASPLPETLPWHVRYANFEGALPAINNFGTRIIGMSWRLRYPFVSCLFGTEVGEPAELKWFREAGGSIITASWTTSFRIIQIGAFCGNLIELSNPGEVFVLNTTTRIRLRLI